MELKNNTRLESALSEEMPMDPSTTLELEPIKIGDYMLENIIGVGSYGKVRLAYHSVTNEKFAVKVIEKSKLKSQKQINRLQREIRFLKLLYHPHIIKVYDVVETQDSIYMFQEYANGGKHHKTAHLQIGELFDYIVANKRVKENEARSFFRQVISAVDYCHKNAVIHRDLKPGMHSWTSNNPKKTCCWMRRKQSRSLISDSVTTFLSMESFLIRLVGIFNSDI